MWPVATTTASQRQAILSATVAVAATAAIALYNSTALLEPAEASKGVKRRDNKNGSNNNPIEINLMDKIANKVYLNPTRSAARHSHHHTTSSSSNLQQQQQHRPLGVPSRLRILAIDLPEMRDEAFSKGTCRVAFDRVFPNGVAPPKQQLVDESNDKSSAAASHGTNSPSNSARSSRSSSSSSTTRRREETVEQKAFVHSMIRCFQDDNARTVGVEVMEASFALLNPNNLRQTRQLGGYHYDPGKYTNTNSSSSSAKVDSQNNNSQSSSGSNKKKTTEEEGTEAAVEDEPWNQYAWMEELKCRLHGFVPFGDSLEPSSRWNRYLTGNSFKQTVPSQRSFLEMLLPPFLQSNPEGVEGGASRNNKNSDQHNNHDNNHNWASNKPHAVIANGAAIQRVPSALRFLQKTCRDANVPLFVLHDPRAWGGNTHSSLHQALLDVRFLVKQNIILQAMEQQSGFSRGRFVGRLERQLEHVIEKAQHDRLQRQEAIRQRRWDKLDSASLEKRLMEHGVLRKEDRLEDGKTYRRYIPAMVQVARQCVADEAERERNEEAQVAGATTATEWAGEGADNATSSLATKT